MSSFLQQTTFTTSTLYNVYIRQFLHEPPSRIDNFYNITTNKFYTKHPFQAPFTPGTLYTRHLFTRQLLQPKQFLHQVPFTPAAFCAKQIYSRHLLHQTTFTPSTLYTRNPLRQIGAKQLLHYTPLTPDSFYTKQLLHQTAFTPNNLYNKQVSHQAPAPNNF